MGRQARVLTGMRFGRLIVHERTIRAGKNPRWRVVCDCGNESEVYGHNLLAGKVRSCGCLKAGPTSWRAVERTYSAGYALIRMPEHPRANKSTGRVREHIVVMERKLGRHLLPGEEVHHLNGIRDDNRPENLELWVRSQPAGVRVSDQVELARQVLMRYAPELLSDTTQ